MSIFDQLLASSRVVSSALLAVAVVSNWFRISDWPLWLFILAVVAALVWFFRSFWNRELPPDHW